MSFNWFDLIVLFGIMQGMVSCVVLVFQKPEELHKKLLIVMIGVLCVLSFKIEIHTLGLWDKRGLRYFPLGIDLLIQPILFLYVSSLTKPGFKFRWKTLLHFLPVTLLFMHSVMVYAAVLPIDDLVQKDVVAERWHFNQVKEIEDLLSVVSAFIYGYLCLVSVRKYQRWLYKFTSDTRFPTLNWVRNLMIATAVLGFGLFINIFIDNIGGSGLSFSRWQFFYFYLAFLIYYLGIKGLMFRTEAVPYQGVVVDEGFERLMKYDAAEMGAAKVKIVTALVEDKIFLDNDLTLQKMSAQLGINQALASSTINQLFGKTFRTLINEYRVAEVKVKLLDPANSHLSFLGVALACGFNSEASFYRIFKAEVGSSPKEFVSAATGGSK